MPITPNWSTLPSTTPATLSRDAPRQHLSRASISLAGIGPPHVRCSTIAQDERRAQELNIRHPLHGQAAPPPRLKSRASFLQTVSPLQISKQTARANMWKDEWSKHDTRAHEWMERGITPTECLASGHNLPWPTWKTLNRLRLEQGRCKALMKTWKYQTEDTGSCGSVQTMSHLLVCADAPCSQQDLAEPTPSAVAYARYGQTTFEIATDSKRRRQLIFFFSKLYTVDLLRFAGPMKQGLNVFFVK